MVLSHLLSQPTPGLVNFWLACAADQGCGVPARRWTRLARLAAHSTAYDRPAWAACSARAGDGSWRRIRTGGGSAADCVVGRGCR